jgi:hypothetical protein
MSKPKLLYVDHSNVDLFKRWFDRTGTVAFDPAKTIDTALDLFSKYEYDVVVFHLDMECKDKFRRRYQRDAESLSGFFRNKHRQFEIGWVPGGAIFLLHMIAQDYE